MTVKEKVERERDNTDKILLYTDGGKFTRAYERSAFAFTKKVHKFEVLSALNKELNEVVVYIGFPTETLGSRVKNYTTEVISGKESMFTVELDEPIDLQEFENWKIQMIEESEKRKKLKAEEAAKKKDEKERNKTKDGKDAAADTTQRVPEAVTPATSGEVIQEILSVNLLKFSPIDALVFLGDIQAKLRNGLPDNAQETKREKLPFEES